MGRDLKISSNLFLLKVTFKENMAGQDGAQSIILLLEKQRQVDLWKFEASLVCIKFHVSQDYTGRTRVKTKQSNQPEAWKV